jgi:hypothetical protein
MSGTQISYNPNKDLSHHADVKTMEHFFSFVFEIIIPFFKKIFKRTK